jgi:NAD+ synthase (glutamine-hydrolysing)
MYNVNCSIPKTLVKFLVEYVAKTEFDGAVSETLMSIVNTEISPELLPPDEKGEITQSTEEKVGPYELHDFFMFNMVRYRFSPEKIMYLAHHATGWQRNYTESEIEKWLKVNISRAFAQQYKRDDVPNGPKVGSVSLSPRGDWRMPSDADPAAWLRTLDES